MKINLTFETEHPKIETKKVQERLFCKNNRTTSNLQSGKQRLGIYLVDEEALFLLTKSDVHFAVDILDYIYSGMKLVEVDCNSIVLEGITLNASFTISNPH